MTRETIELNTIYNISSLVDAAKKNLRSSIIKISLYVVLFIASVLSIILWGSYLSVFIAGAVVASVAILLCVKKLKEIEIADYSIARGEITEVHKEIKIVDTKSVGTINPFGSRKYDSYKKNQIRLSVFIKENGQIRAYYINRANDEHVRYYEANGDVIHIWGTHFPVKLELDNKKWLCPVCGEFNANEEKICAKCKNKVIK